MTDYLSKEEIAELISKAIEEQVLMEGKPLHDWMKKIDNRHEIEDYNYRMGRRFIVIFGAIISTVITFANFRDFFIGWLTNGN